MRVLMLTRYGALGASSRLRSMQYVPALQSEGIDATVCPLLNDNYVRDLYAGKVSVRDVARGYVGRLRHVRDLSEFDAVWVEKEAWPWLPDWLERPLLGGCNRLVVDYDDALFHRYDSHRSSLVRAMLGRKISAIMRRADLVTVGNDYLAAHAKAAGAGHVEWVPTVVDLERYPRVTREREAGPPIIGWIGSPSTAGYLREVSTAFAPMHAAGKIRCIAIGARPEQVANTPFEPVEWREETEVSQLQDLDIGIMPLPDAPWERGKCGYKLIQYMACGVPVLASPVGVNEVIVKPGKNGFLATTPEEWREGVGRLVGDPALRMAMGDAGRSQVEDIYSLQAQAPRLARLLRGIQRQESI